MSKRKTDAAACNHTFQATVAIVIAFPIFRCSLPLPKQMSFSAKFKRFPLWGYLAIGFALLLFYVIRSGSWESLSRSKIILDWMGVIAGAAIAIHAKTNCASTPRGRSLEQGAGVLVATVGLGSMLLGSQIATREPLVSAVADLRLSMEPTSILLGERRHPMLGISLLKGRRISAFLKCDHYDWWGNSNKCTHITANYSLIEGSAAVGKPLSFIESSDALAVDLWMLPFKPEAHVLTGKCVITVNGTIRKEYPIAAQAVPWRACVTNLKFKDDLAPIILP